MFYQKTVWIHRFLDNNFFFTKPAISLTKQWHKGALNISRFFFLAIYSLLPSILFAKIIYQYVLSHFFEKYSYFISGVIAFNNAVKSQDFFVFYTLILTFCISFLFLYYFSRFLSRETPYEFQHAFYWVAIISSIPGIIQATSMAFSDFQVIPFFIFISLMSGLIIIFLSFLLIKKKFLLIKDFEQLIFSFLSPILINYFVFFSIQSIFIWLYTDPNSFLPRSKYLIFALSFGIIILTNLIIFLIVGFSKNQKKIMRFLKRTLILSQVFILMGVFINYPPLWEKEGHYFTSIQHTALLDIFAGLFISGGIVGLFYRYKTLTIRNTLKNKFDLSHYISVFSLVVIIILISMNTFRSGNVVFLGDDYHEGEFLVPFQQTFQFNSIPFWDYSPARGLINYANAFLGSLFYEYTAEAFLSTNTLFFFIISIIYLYVYKRLIGYPLAIVGLISLLFSANGYINVFLFLAVYFGVIILIFKNLNPKQFLVLWMPLSVFTFLWATSQGAIIVLGTIPMGVIKLMDLFKIYSLKECLLYIIIYALVIFLILLIIPSFTNMVVGNLRYLIENATTNVEANAKPFYLTKSQYSHNIPYFIAHLISNSSIVVGIISFSISVLWLQGKKYRELTSISIPIFVMSFISISVSMGRMDSVFSRNWAYSAFFIYIILPILFIMFFGTQSKLTHGPLLFSIFLINTLVFSITNPQSLSEIQSRFAINTLRMKNYPDDLICGEKIGIEQIGCVRMTGKDINRIISIKSVLDSLLMPEETYLDITNRNAHYFYFDRRVPIEVSAAYNLYNPSQINRNIEKLERQDIELVLTYADNILHDGGTSSLRSHDLYRYLIKNYVAVEIDGYGYMVKEGFLPKVQEIYPLMPFELEEEYQMKLLNQFFRNSNLRYLPLSWGKSFSTLDEYMIELADIHPSPVFLNNMEQIDEGQFRVLNDDDPYLVFDISDLEMNGEKANLLYLDFAVFENGKLMENERVPTFQGFYQNDLTRFSEETSFTFNGEASGQYIIPLDAYPYWFLAKHQQQLRLDFNYNTSFNENNVYTIHLNELKVFEKKDF